MVLLQQKLKKVRASRDRLNNWRNFLQNLSINTAQNLNENNNESIDDNNQEYDFDMEARIKLTEPIMMSKHEELPLTEWEAKVKKAIEENDDLTALLQEMNLEQLRLPSGVMDSEYEGMYELATGLQSNLRLTDNEAIKRDLFCRSVARLMRYIEAQEDAKSPSEDIEMLDPSDEEVMRNRQLGTYLEALSTSIGIKDPEECGLYYDQLPPCYSLGSQDDNE